MEEFEVSAKTVDEAIEEAIGRLQVDKSEVEIEIISKGKQGLFGLGSEDAKIRVKRRSHESKENIAPLAKEILENILSLMKIPATVEIRENHGEESNVTLDVSGDELGVLIGRRGDSLTSLQYIVNLIVSRKLKLNARVTVDVERYRERRYDALRNLALRMGDEAKSSGRSISLEPMPSNERRIVHLALRDSSDVTTQSVGQGESRKVVILPKN